MPRLRIFDALLPRVRLWHFWDSSRLSNLSADRRKGGGITKAGNYRCRTLLVESAQHYSRKPCVSYQMKHKLARADARTNTVVINCMHRLHKRYWHLHLKGKIRQQAIVAVARELVGFVWDLMREPVELQAAA